MRLLLLSDIHWITSAEEQDPDFEMRRKFERDLKDFVSQNGGFDYVLISGDVASKGIKEEFDAAYNFVQGLCEIVGCTPDCVYVVPGNHDKNFEANSPALRHLIDAGLSNEKIDADKKFTELLKKDYNSIKLMYQPFKDYHSFAFSFDSDEPIMRKAIIDEAAYGTYNCETDKFYLKSQLKDLDGYQVYLYCLNTAFVSDWDDLKDDGKGHKMFLSSLSYQAPADTEGCVNIAMMHHPTSHIVEGNKVAEALDKNFQVQIFGHLHRPSSNNKNAVHIESGAFQPPKEVGNINYFSVYNIVDLGIKAKDENTDSLEINLRVQKYNDDSRRFEEVAEESKKYSVELKKHINRWAQQQAPAQAAALPEGISVRMVRVKFLQSSNRKALIGKDYDEKVSMTENCVRFLNKMEQEGKLAELWHKMK